MPPGPVRTASTSSAAPAADDVAASGAGVPERLHSNGSCWVAVNVVGMKTPRWTSIPALTGERETVGAYRFAAVTVCRPPPIPST